MPVIKGKKWNSTAKIRNALRRVWQFSPMRKEALNQARVMNGLLRCQGCGSLFTAKDVAVNHIHQVTAGGGATDWNIYIERLFCPTDGLNILCKGCHQQVTNAERAAKKKAKAA